MFFRYPMLCRRYSSTLLLSCRSCRERKGTGLVQALPTIQTSPSYQHPLPSLAIPSQEPCEAEVQGEQQAQGAWGGVGAETPLSRCQGLYMPGSCV